MHEDSEEESSIDDFDNTKCDTTLLYDSDECNIIFLRGLIERIISTCLSQDYFLKSTSSNLFFSSQEDFFLKKSFSNNINVSEIFGRVLRAI